MASNRRSSVGLVVAGSLASGLLLALLLAFAPFVPATERDVLGAVLCGFAVGWAVLAVLSTRLTDQPQRWALAPASFMGGCGLLLLVFGSDVDDALAWVWPPALLLVVVWSAVRARRTLRSWTRRWLLGPVLALLVLASVGGAYETIGSATAPTYAAPGRLVDVGGHRLHLSCTGSGSPTVVLEPGAGGMSSHLGWIAPRVGRDTRVCVHDRAGRGWSDPADTAQDASQIAADLHVLLERGGVPGPYVLGGHSFGGLYVLTFAARFPDEVSGLVLIDSTAPASDPGDQPSPADPDGPMRHASALLATVSRVGLSRLYAGLDFGSLPPRSRDEARASAATEKDLRSTIDEYVRAGASAREAAVARDLGDTPLMVLTAGKGHPATWREDQDALARLSTDSAHRVVDGAAHGDLVMEERPADVVATAILDVVSAVRTGQPLR